MRYEKHICTILLIIIVSGLTIVLNSGIRYISKLENQITERDLLIDKLAISEALVKEYFDIKQDSLTNEITYSLKPSKQEPVQIVYRNMSETFQAGNEILSSEEVVERYNSLIVEFSQYVDEHEKLIDTYNNLFKSYNNLIKEHNELVNLYNRTSKDRSYINALQTALKMIDDRYGISYNIKLDSAAYKITLPSFSRADSALVLLPYFRECLKYDNEIGAWIVTRKYIKEK